MVHPSGRADELDATLRVALERCLGVGARGVGIGGGGAAEDVLARLLGADLDAPSARSDRLAALLTAASSARISCPRGTLLELDRLCPTTVAGGALAAGAGPDGLRLERPLRAHGAAGLNLAEFGIGTNDRARLSGSVVEDEKILGSVHVAFGASASIGGTVTASTHVDCVVPEATVLLDGEPVLDDGRLLVEAG